MVPLLTVGKPLENGGCLFLFRLAVFALTNAARTKVSLPLYLVASFVAKPLHFTQLLFVRSGFLSRSKTGRVCSFRVFVAYAFF